MTERKSSTSHWINLSSISWILIRLIANFSEDIHLLDKCVKAHNFVNYKLTAYRSQNCRTKLSARTLMSGLFLRSPLLVPRSGKADLRKGLKPPARLWQENLTIYKPQNYRTAHLHRARTEYFISPLYHPTPNQGCAGYSRQLPEFRNRAQSPKRENPSGNTTAWFLHQPGQGTRTHQNGSSCICA